MFSLAGSPDVHDQVYDLSDLEGWVLNAAPHPIRSDRRGCLQKAA
jgi:hypothetical protein